MNIKRTLSMSLVMLMLLCAPSTVLIGASVCLASPIQTEAAGLTDDGNIYVGHIVTLKITTREFSADEIRERFRDFEITELKEESDGYLISIRTFEAGEHKVLLGDKEIVIDVSSTLEDIEREDIFEGEAWVIEPGLLFPWRILLYIAVSLFCLSGGFVLIKTFLGGKTRLLSPLQIFLRNSGSLAAEDDNFFVDLTYYFKEYLGSLYQCRIIGKTSNEIINEIKDIRALESLLTELRGWLAECDRFKFTGVKVSKEDKQGHYEKLLALVKKIDAQKEVAA